MSADACPDAVFPSSNSEGVADLMSSMQGDFFDTPLCWGSVRRVGDFRGRTVHFFTDDYRFATVWNKPDKVWQTGAPSFVEVNFSTSNALPRWRALELIGKKRFLSRYWQERGMRCWVDLNVSSRFWDENLLGVHLGWLAYATRIEKRSTLKDIMDQAALAESQAGTDAIKFAIYGHRQEIEALCQRNGWIYVDEQSTIWSKRESCKSRTKEASLQFEIKLDEREHINYKQKTLMELI